MGKVTQMSKKVKLMQNQLNLDFSLRGNDEKHIKRIFHAKGGYYGLAFWWLLFIFIFLLIAMPPARTYAVLIFKGLLILGILSIVYQYYKVVIKISIDDENLFIRVWKNEKKYTIREITKIKLTYYAAYSGATMRIKGAKRGFYIIWAPTFDERYSLYLKLNDYLKERNMLQ